MEKKIKKKGKRKNPNLFGTSNVFYLQKDKILLKIGYCK
jgi:hypothetical protein